MSMTQEILEMLIGKYLDGEITSSERQMLQAAMESDPDARELLEQLQDLHQQSREVISSEVLDKGKTAEEIFEQAWRHRTKSPLHHIFGISSRFRFVAGLAAGLVIGLTLHFALPVRSVPKSDMIPETVVAQSTTDQADADIEQLSTQSFPSSHAQNVSRNVDWYSFKDENGDQWLIEGYRQSIVKPVAYNPDL